MPRNYPVPHAGPLDSTAGNQRDGIIFPAASRAAGTYTSPEYVNPGANGLRLFINTTVAGTSNDVVVQNFDPASQTWMNVPDAAVPQITGTGAVVFTVYPGSTGAQTTGDSDPNTVATNLGVRWRIQATTVGTTNFSIGGDYLDR